MDGIKNQNAEKLRRARVAVTSDFASVKSRLLGECHGAEAVMDALEFLDTAYKAALYALEHHSIYGLPPEEPTL